MSKSVHVDGPVGPVVVGCDGSWSGGQAVLAAATAARRRGAQLKLLVVERPPTTSTDGRETPAEHARYVGETARIQSHGAEPGVDTEVIVVPDVHDPRVDELGRGASLLVLGSYGAGGQVALSLGSTSETLSRLFACPILLPHARVGESLRAGTRPPTVVAAVSRDDSAHQVVAAAAREAAERQVPLLVVHAISMPDATQLAAEQDWVVSVLDAVGVPSWLPQRTVVAVADPVAAVLDRVESDDLLVVATRGEGRLAGLVAGSVTRALLDAGQCDVLVVSHGVVSHGGVGHGSVGHGGVRHEAFGSGVVSHEGAGTSAPPPSAPTPVPDLKAAAILSPTECWSFLRSAAVGRLGIVVDGRPDIFPVNHVVGRESILFRTAEGSKLDACLDQPVAFEVDGFDSATGEAWSVVLKGTARELRERDEVIRALRLSITPWPSDPKPRIVQIDPDPGAGAVTGRRFRVFGGLTAMSSSPARGWLSPTGPGKVPAQR